MITDSNYLVGKWAAPNFTDDYWKISHMSIADDFTIRIRGEKSCWFRADSCFISDAEDVRDHVESKRIQGLIKKFTWQIDTIEVSRNENSLIYRQLEKLCQQQ